MSENIFKQTSVTPYTNGDTKCETCGGIGFKFVIGDPNRHNVPCPTCTPPTGDGLEERAKAYWYNAPDEATSWDILAAFACQIRDEAVEKLTKERDDYYAQVLGLRGSIQHLTSERTKLSRSVPIGTLEGWLSTCASKHMGGMETRQEIRFKIKEYQRCSSSGGSDGGVSTVNRHSGGGSHGSPSSEPSPLPGATSNPELSSAPAAAPASDPAATGLRPSVAAFAWRMEATLRRHDAKKGGQKNWRKDDVLDLRDRLLDETEELRLATHLPDYDDRRRRVAAEAIDVANFAMMIADKCDPLPDDSDPAATGGDDGGEIE